MAKNLEDLVVWKESIQFAKEVYLHTRPFPKEEQYNIIKHVHECARSIPGNIAEGYGRFHFQEAIQFYRIARGSAYELRSDLHLAFELHYLNEDNLHELLNHLERIVRMLNGLIAATKKLKNSQ